MKWYASYNSVEKRHLLLSAKSLAKERENASANRDLELHHALDGLQEFPSLREAKAYIRGGYECDLSIIREGLFELRKTKAR